MIKGLSLGRKPEFQDGGLMRSMGGKKAALTEIRKGNTEKSDSRILGDGPFVRLTLAESEKMLEKKYLPKRSIAELIEDVAVQTGVTPELICSYSRNRKCCKARYILNDYKLLISFNTKKRLTCAIYDGPISLTLFPAWKNGSKNT
ncbi:MAG: hypothetical protein WA151_09915 [Desulfatirhabdiaceae bacterium]